MVLIETIRVTGVVFALWGAVISVPEAVPRIGKDFAKLGVKLWHVLRRRPADMHYGAANGTTVRVNGTATGDSGFASKLEGSITEQLEQLRVRTNALSERISAMQHDLALLTNEVRRLTEATQASYKALLKNIKETHTYAEEKSLKLNARGLPLIGLSILLSGLPDRWVGIPWVAGILLALAAILLLVTLLRLIRPGLIDS